MRRNDAGVGQLWPLAMALAGTCLASAVLAEPDTDFTMKRVGPPQSGATRLITVQVAVAVPPTVPVEAVTDAAALDPALAAALAEGATLAPLDPPAETGATPSDMFWAFLPDAPGPSRLAQAAALLDAAPDAARGVTNKRHLGRLARRHGAEIQRLAQGTAVSPALALAVIAVESAGDADAVSSAGAGGLMQLMPATAARFGVEDRFDPAQNIRGGVAYLDWLLREFDGDVILALAGYNAGENAVKRHRGVPPYEETRAYVPKVISAWQMVSELCRPRQDASQAVCSSTALARAEP